jgi:ABC-type methionine transport system ATPase subunit
MILNLIKSNLRKHLVLMSADRMAAEREIKRINANERDPVLQKLLESTKTMNFAEQQRALASSADVVGLTCASATIDQATVHVIVAGAGAMGVWTAGQGRRRRVGVRRRRRRGA